MSDLVERLRWLASPDAERISDYHRINEFCKSSHEAAARIEALEAALAMIVLSSKDSASVEIARAALDPTAQIDWDIMSEERLEQRPRAALAPEQDK